MDGLHSGINFIDTAEMYRTSTETQEKESYIKKWLSRRGERKMFWHKVADLQNG